VAQFRQIVQSVNYNSFCKQPIYKDFPAPGVSQWQIEEAKTEERKSCTDCRFLGIHITLFIMKKCLEHPFDLFFRKL
jgi:hypothetical protein